MSDQPDHLILKFLSGTATAEEKQQLDAWAALSADNNNTLQEYKRIWEEKSTVVTPDFRTSEEWSRLKTKLYDLEGKQVNLQNRRLFVKVAASLILMAVCAALVYRMAVRTDDIVLQSENEKRRVSLPDGSTVWLNTKSRLIYSSDFNNERNIQLDGEAFFDVTPDTEKPFVITTPQSQIRVLGTSFNVSAYSHNTLEEVYVATGKVRVASGDHQVELTPGELSTMNKITRVLSSADASNENKMAWRTGKLVFLKTNLIEVAQTLEHYFQISINIKNPVIEKCRFTSSFTNPTLEEVIEAISLSMNINVVHQNKEYVFDGDGCATETP
ncbi:MAG TPA: FecR domain-containing protein [Ohtaekwangia sp.]